jgi:hypothetical protein
VPAIIASNKWRSNGSDGSGWIVGKPETIEKRFREVNERSPRSPLLAQNDFRFPSDSLATDKIHEGGGAPGEARPFAASQKTKMSDDVTGSIQASYDQLASECARRSFNELQYKPLDRLLDRFATEVSGRGEVCDMGPAMGSCAKRICGGALFPWIFSISAFGNPKKPEGLRLKR